MSRHRTSLEPWNPADDPYLWPRLEKAWVRLVEEGGLSEDEATARMLEALDGITPVAIAHAKAGITRTLRRTAPRMLASHERTRRGFENRIDVVWGEGLDRLYEVFVICQEIGYGFNQTHRPAAAEEDDLRFEALCAVHARACTTTSEIHALLRTGHPFGARARWRTLHELAVVASVLGDGDDDLANRFLIHASAEAYVDALEHDKHHVRLGRDPYPPEELAELKAFHDAAAAQYGRSFAGPWRWADPVTAPEPATFWRLELAAELDHLHPIFRDSSHVVHAGSSGAAFNRLEYRGQEVFLTGSTNKGFESVGHGSAISLSQVTLALVTHGREEGLSPIGLAGLQALMTVVHDTGEAFLRGAEELDRRETEYATAEARGRRALAALNVRRAGRASLRASRRAGRRVLAHAPRAPDWLRRRSRGGPDEGDEVLEGKDGELVEDLGDVDDEER